MNRAVSSEATSCKAGRMTMPMRTRTKTLLDSCSTAAYSPPPPSTTPATQRQYSPAAGWPVSDTEALKAPTIPPTECRQQQQQQQQQHGATTAARRRRSGGWTCTAICGLLDEVPMTASMLTRGKDWSK